MKLDNGANFLHGSFKVFSPHLYLVSNSKAL